jgi:type I restriction enzyme S subunit
MTEWQEKKLGEFITLQRGHDLPEPERKEGTIPIIGSFGITGYHNTAKAKGPGVTVGRSGGSMGVVTYSSVDYWPLNTALYVIDFHNNNERFAYYLLKSLDFTRYNSGSAQPSLNRNYIHPILIRVPPLSIQQHIADILAALDDKIECNRRINQTLEEMAQALYNHWFVDSPHSEAQPITDLVDVDPLVRIPKGKEVPFVEMKALPTGAMSVTDVARRPFTAGSRFQNGDTLFARITPCLENGKTAFVDFLEDHEAGFGSTEFIVLRAKQGISPQFVYCCTRDENFRAHAIKSMVGSSGRQRVRSDCFEHFCLKSFDGQTMEQFHEQTLVWFKQIRSNIKENQILASTRDYLLPKIMSGEIEIKAMEEVAGSAL